MPSPNAPQDVLKRHVAALRRCRLCPLMIPPVVTGDPVLSRVMLIGQAPGPKEGSFGKPFAWTAGKTLFKWFDTLGMSEDVFRERVYMAAVCRCFPGKNPKGGDRVPNDLEISNCSRWMQAELDLLKPELVIPVGKLAITQFMPISKLDEVIGLTHRLSKGATMIPLPHPSGASTWHRMEPGKTLLEKALKLIGKHPAFRALK